MKFAGVPTSTPSVDTSIPQPLDSTPQPVVETPQPAIDLSKLSNDDLLKAAGVSSEASTAKTTQVEIIPSQKTLEQQRQDDEASLLNQYKEQDREKAHQERLIWDETYAMSYGKKNAGALESSMLDPLEFQFAGKVIEGVGKVVSKVEWPTHIKKIFSSLDAKAYEEQQNLFTFMNKQGINPTDALIEGSKGSDLRSYLSGHNLFAVKEAFNSQTKLADNYLQMTDNILGKLKQNKIDVNDITSWRSIKPTEDIITDEVNKLRASYKAIENDMYGNVKQVAKGINEEYKVNELTVDLRKTLTDEGIPTEAVNIVNTILNRFTKPYKEETADLAKGFKDRAYILADIRATNKIAESATTARQGAAAELKLEKLQAKLGTTNETINSLKDTRYMTVEDLLNTSKLINRKIYKPGGAISIKDADELRGLQIAKQKIDDFLFAKVKDPSLRDALQSAREVTIARAGLFGAKDTGGEKLMLAKLLDKGEFGKVTEYMTGVNAKENILYIRDTFGRDSEAYRASFSNYINNKLGVTPENIQGILDQSKAISTANRVDVQAAAAKISKIDEQDLAMLENINGKQARLDLVALKKLTTNMADLENAATQYGRGITGGKRAYVMGGEALGSSVGRAVKLITDATTFHMAKTAEKIVYNQPKLRAITGAVTGETIYLSNTEQKDLNLHDALTSAVLGATGGYYAGRAMRSLLESDINKVSRYLKEGRGMPMGMKEDLRKSLERIGQATGGQKIGSEIAPGK